MPEWSSMEGASLARPAKLGPAPAHRGVSVTIQLTLVEISQGPVRRSGTTRHARTGAGGLRHTAPRWRRPPAVHADETRRLPRGGLPPGV